MKIISLLAYSYLILTACNNASTVKESNPIDVAMDSYKTFLEEFEVELKNAIEAGATSDEWESAIQTLLSSSLESNNEIQRKWNKMGLIKGTPLYEQYLEKWLKLELKRFQLEESVLVAWHNVEVNGLSEAMFELAAAEATLQEELLEEESVSNQILKKLMNEDSEIEVQSIREKLLKMQLETDSLFGEAQNQLLVRKSQLEENPASLVN